MLSTALSDVGSNPTQTLCNPQIVALSLGVLCVCYIYIYIAIRDTGIFQVWNCPIKNTTKQTQEHKLEFSLHKLLLFIIFM